MSAEIRARQWAPLPLLALCAVVALVSVGFARGVWLPNLHNGLLAFAFSFVGAAILFGRPRQREGLLFLAAGTLQAVMFVGRQIGHDSSAYDDRWWGWFGVWPVAITLGTVTWCILCFPEGRFLSRRWVWVGAAVAVLATACSLLSALWPVEYADTGVRTPHPLSLGGADTADAIWSALAHSTYVGLQLLWVVAVVVRWRQSSGSTRSQLTVMLGAVAVSAAALVIGLIVAGSPRAGILAATLIPVAAGVAIHRLSLARVIEEQTEAGRLEGLSPRENEVLDLMAEGLSNAAICARLHLSIKTVEPVVSAIFIKLGLPADSDSNRRVLAVLEYLRR
ncbi:MAG: LuxR C-terminal-related transcriptional regulator [Aeromicrobium sp.]